jgi:sulfate transport system permease protein
VINTIFGVGISLLLVRYTFPGRRALNAMVDLPLSVSPVVVGLALVLVYSGRTGWLGQGLEQPACRLSMHRRESSWRRRSSACHS